jgi:hypothetical protein
MVHGGEGATTILVTQRCGREGGAGTRAGVLRQQSCCAGARRLGACAAAAVLRVGWMWAVRNGSVVYRRSRCARLLGESLLGRRSGTPYWRCRGVVCHA